MDDIASPLSSIMASPLPEQFANLTMSSATVPSGTVSPKDLMSGPPSSFSTELGTPQSFFDSPAIYSYNFSASTSIYMADGDLPMDHQDWLPLFSDTKDMTGEDFDMTLATFEPEKVDKALVTSFSVPAAAPADLSTALTVRKVDPAVLPTIKKNDPSRVTKIRCEKLGGKKTGEKVLEYDPDDPKSVKRMRNTIAARKSRQKKHDNTVAMMSRIEELEALLAESERKAEHWKSVAENFQLSSLSLETAM